MFIAIYLTI